MKANYDENLLLGYVENDLSDDDRATVEQWIRQDARLASLLKAMADDRTAMRDLPEPAAPPWLMDDVDRGLERTMLIDASAIDIDTSNIEQQYNVRRIFVGLAAAASILIAGGVVIWSVIGPNNDRVAFEPHHDEVAMTERGVEDEGAIEDDSTPTITISKGAGTGRSPEPSTELVGKTGPTTQANVALKPGPGKAGPTVADGQAVQDGHESNGLAQLILPANPADEPVSIVVQTRDVSRSMEQLSFVAKNIDRALVEPYDYNGDPWPYAPEDNGTATNPAPAENAAETATQGQQALADATQQAAQPGKQQAGIMAHRTAYTYNLILPADQLDKAVDLLANGSTGTKIEYQDVNLNRFGEARRYESLANARRNWPRQTPDYADILRQQLPLEQAEDAQAIAEQVIVPVIIEHQAEAEVQQVQQDAQVEQVEPQDANND
jgi:hypothetical protein